MPICSGGAQKLKVIEESFVAAISGVEKDAELLLEQAVELAKNHDSVSSILEGVQVTSQNSKGRLTLGGFSQGIGEVGCVGIERYDVGGDVFAVGCGMDDALYMFKKIEKIIRSTDDPDKIFHYLRLCLAFACTLRRGSGGFCSEAMIIGASAHLRFLRRHLITLLSDHFVELGIFGYIFISDYVTEEMEVFEFWKDSKNKKGVDAVWIAGACNNLIVWIFEVDDEFEAEPLSSDLDPTTENTFFPLTKKRLKDIAEEHFQTVNLELDGPADSAEKLNKW